MPAAPYAHMATSGAVPAKCSDCTHLFEGECLRGAERHGVHLELDNGPCSVTGDITPVDVQPPGGGSEVFVVPAKCSGCEHLRWVNGRYRCADRADVWGEWMRSLDWGEHRERYPWPAHNRRPVPRTLRALILGGRRTDAVAMIRRLWGTPIGEAVAMYGEWRAIMEGGE